MDKIFTHFLQNTEEKNVLLSLNSLTATFGLTLCKEDLTLLEETHSEALVASGRVEFSDGTIQKLATAFCDSPYVSQENWAQTLSELIDCFYYYKTESGDTISDDTLIAQMQLIFNTTAHGSLDYMSSNLEQLCRRRKNGGAL